MHSRGKWLGNRLYFHALLRKALVRLVAAGKLERVGDIRFAGRHASNHVRATDPVSFFEICLRPLRGMIGLRMVESDDIFGTLSSLSLDPNQLLWIYVITSLRRIGAG